MSIWLASPDQAITTACACSRTHCSSTRRKQRRRKQLLTVRTLRGCAPSSSWTVIAVSGRIPATQMTPANLQQRSDQWPKVAKKHPVLEWFVATSDELYLRAREGPIGLMSLPDHAQGYNLLRGPQPAPTAGIEV